MKSARTTLTKEQRLFAAQAVKKEANTLNQKIFALAVCNNHIHLVAQNINLPIGQVVSHYKHAVRLALQEKGFEGKLWTQGFDKRYCMNNRELDARIVYVRKHKNYLVSVAEKRKRHTRESRYLIRITGPPPARE
jgi:REP element-mobilizing transposase RayT